MVGPLWTESSFSGPHPCSLTSAENPFLPKDRSTGGSPETEAVCSVTASLGWSLAWNQAPTSQPAPFCLGGDSSKPRFTSPLLQTLNYLAWVVRALLSSAIGVEGLRNVQTPESGLQTSQSSAQCTWHPGRTE